MSEAIFIGAGVLIVLLIVVAARMGPAWIGQMISGASISGEHKD